MSSPTPDRPITVPMIRARKRRDGVRARGDGHRLRRALGRLADAAEVDVFLVGDSVANNVLGYEDTMQVSMDDMVHHTAAVARANPRA